MQILHSLAVRHVSAPVSFSCLLHSIQHWAQFAMKVSLSVSVLCPSLCLCLSSLGLSHVCVAVCAVHTYFVCIHLFVGICADMHVYTHERQGFMSHASLLGPAPYFMRQGLSELGTD